MNELTNWLKQQSAQDAADGCFDSEARHLEAAREIERLTAIVDRLQSALSRIQTVPGCECDAYQDHLCLMCKVREIAREGLDQ